MLIRKPELNSYYEIYRNGNYCATVLTKTEVLDFIFDDHVRTAGIFEYSFKFFNSQKDEKKESPLQVQVLRFNV